MRILHIDTGRSMHGGQWQVLYLLRGLRQRGIESRLLAPAGSPLRKAAQESGCDAEPLRTLGTGKFDLVHAHDGHAHTLALLSWRPVIVSRRVAFPLKRSPASRYKYSRTARFLAVSEYVRRVLLDAGIPEERISVVYDGVPLPEPAGWSHRSDVIALDTEDPAKGKSVVEQASHLAAIPVRFSSALAKDLPDARLFVYITELEGLGSAALLAMAHGVPVLASRTGGLPEIVADGNTGLLTSNDASEVAAGIVRLTDNPALAMRFGQNGRAMVERGFTVDHMVESTIRAYRQVLSC